MTKAARSNSTISHKYSIFLGRFMPWHLAHQAIAVKSLEFTEKLIIVLGSHNRARTIENPWSTVDRKEYIMNSMVEALGESVRDRILFTAVPDRLYNNNLWLSNVNTVVKATMIASGGNDTDSAIMVGHYKDSGSWWLEKFPQWDQRDLGGIPDMHATKIREAYFKLQPDFDMIEQLVSPSIMNYLLNTFRFGDVSGEADGPCQQYLTLAGEMDFVHKYKKPYEHLPYGVKHVTADAVVFCAGHILMIRRRSFPGKGLWALPGGHIEMDEDVNEYAAIRELIEETGLKVPLKILEGSLRGEKVFGHPRRSLIGRVITHSYMFELDLPPDGNFPHVKSMGMDDADRAKWIPIDEVSESKCFDDHYQLIDYWKGRTSK